MGVRALFPFSEVGGAGLPLLTLEGIQVFAHILLLVKEQAV